ncbi:MAG: 2,3-bisphosphoglycerate-dependent phosphoglycerate mutase [Nitrosomonas sp.]|nr:2,3-bisphosphoglycerate-dependent phosphoglycerate mutase [Nitrosomonas sp.]
MSLDQASIRLVLLRHGQSVWNHEGRFTGWSDVALSARGEAEARRAGVILKQCGFTFDACFTSELKRAQNTLARIQSVMRSGHLPVYRDWRLNERHYGALEGLRRFDAVRQFGIRPVLDCQLRFDSVPPLLAIEDPRAPANQPCYASIDRTCLPLAESLHQTLYRVLPLWQGAILPEIQKGRQLLIVSHKNLLKTLMMQLEGLTHWQAMRLPITTGKPLCYELDAQLKPVRRYYLVASDRHLL